jgi:hypothetical protein
MVAWPHMDVFSFATGGNNGVVARILLLHGGSNNLFSDQLVRFVLVLSICDMPFSGSSAPVVAKAEFCTGLPSSTWLMLVVPAFASLAVAEVVPLISVQCIGETIRWLLRHCPRFGAMFLRWLVGFVRVGLLLTVLSPLDGALDISSG